MVRIWFVLLLSLFTLPAWAFSSAQCGALLSNTEFAVTYKLDPASDNDVIYATKRNPRKARDYVPIWSNNANVGAVITDYDTSPGYVYNIALSYQTTSNKAGILEYYLLRDGAWDLISSEFADLTDLSAAIAVSGDGQGVNEVECSNTPELPPVEIDVDVCPFVPEVAQSNVYWNRQPQGQLAITNGTGSKLVLPSDGTELSFKNYAGGAGCDYPSLGIQTCQVDPIKHYLNFPPVINDYSVDREAAVNCTGGDCGDLAARKYESVFLGTDSTINLTGGHYYIGTLTMLGGAQITITAPSVIHYKQAVFDQSGSVNPIKINDGGVSEDLLIIGHGAASNWSVPWTVEGMSVYGYIYVDPANTRGGGFDIGATDFYLSGGVSAHSVNISGWNGIIASRSQHQCVTPGNRFDIRISPSTQMALACGSASPNFTVNTSKNGVAESLQVKVEIYRSSPGDSSYLSAEVANGIGQNNGGGYFSSNTSGELRLSVRSTSPSKTDLENPYTIQITMVDDESKEVAATFSYVPFLIAVDNLDVVAGDVFPREGQTWNQEVWACTENNTAVIASSYSGSPSVSHSVIYPSKTDGGIDGTLTYQPQFSAGKSNSSLSIDEAGDFQVTLVEPKFDCTGLRDCPIDGQKELTGTFHVRSRPDRFAICSQDNESVDGYSYAGPGYRAAGDPFTLYAKPVMYGARNAQACTEDNTGVTQNYFFTDGRVAAMPVLDSPIEGEVGGLKPISLLNQSITGVAPDNGGYAFANLRYSEVGSFKFKVNETSAFFSNILGGFSGRLSIGRFYPAYFELEGDNSWDYPSSQNFAYMHQPFDGYQFNLSAYNSAGEKVKNYTWFEPQFQAKIALSEMGSTPNRLISPSLDKGRWSSATAGGEDFALGEFDYSSPSTHNCATGFCWTKATDFVPDGPLNLSGNSDSQISLTVDPLVNEDPVKFTPTRAETLLLPVQPQILFGRLHLADVDGPTGRDIAIPLQTQYWNGNTFAVNGQDNATSFIGSNSCSSSTNVTASGSATVVDGESQQLIASQQTARREQARIQLALSAPPEPSCSAPGVNLLPWLRYDWDQDKNDEEDPQALVTFGIFRGNDKIIFRGETGLTGG